MFDLTDALKHHDAAWRRAEPRLRALYNAVDRPTDLCFDDWQMLFRTLETFRPTWIVELGRCTGNSTMLFLEHCDRHGATLTSLDLDNAHFADTLGRMHRIGVEPPESLDAQDIRTMNILDWTPSADAPTGPTLLFVDAHGDDLGRHVVDTLIPEFRHRGYPLLVVVHDIVDLRFETLAPKKFDLAYQWRHYASPFCEINQLSELWDEFGVQSAAEARKIVTGMDTRIDDSVGFCGVFVTCYVPPLPAKSNKSARPAAAVGARG